MVSKYPHAIDRRKRSLTFLEGSPLPKPSRGPRSGPSGPNDMLGGGGGMVFDTEDTSHKLRGRPLGRRPSPDIVMPSTRAEDVADAVVDTGVSSPPPPGLRSRPPTSTPTAMPPNAQQRFHMPPTATMPDMGGFAPRDFPSYGLGGNGFSPAAGYMSAGMLSGRPSRLGRHVSFGPGQQGLARPRSDEENRGEPEAGGTADRRDAQP